MKKFPLKQNGFRGMLKAVSRPFGITKHRLLLCLGICSIAVFGFLENHRAHAASISAPSIAVPPASPTTSTPSASSSTQTVVGVHKPLVSPTTTNSSSTRPSAPPVSTPSVPAASTPSAAFAKGYVLVQPRAGLPSAEFDRALAQHGGRKAAQLGNLNIYIVTLPPNASEQAIAHALAQHPHIKFAEVDQLVPPSFTPNDTYYGSEWHLQAINASAAWDQSTGSGVTVAVLDSGVDATHPDLQGQLVPGWNFYDNNNDTTDVYGHGTKVAGVIGAIGNNATGVAGVAWNAKIMPVRVTDTSGTGTWSGIASGLNWAADHGAKVANLSFAVQASASTQTAAQYFKNKGGVVVNSAGNYGVLDSTPPTDVLLSVSATDSSDSIASWSSFGPYVDVSAPGVGIWTTTMGGGYGAVSGTSFSSPLTAGVIALVMAANPTLSPSQVVSVLETTAVDLGTPGYDYYYGYGRINAGAAVLAASQGHASDTQAPTVAITSPASGTMSGIVPVNVSASDNVGVTHVDLYVNGGFLASDLAAPYEFSWDTAGLIGTSATLVARAYDAAGNSTSSSPVTVTVASAPTPPADSTPPTVAITSPTTGTVRGTVSVNVSASDNVGVTRVDLLINGSVFASDTASPYSFSWDSTPLGGTSATLVARAYDAAGNSTDSSPVTLSVASAPPPPTADTTPPTVAISSPADGTSVNGMVTISASATDNVGVATITLSVDGAVVSTGNGASRSYRWNTRKAAAGTHTITAVARDTSGNSTTATIHVTR